MGKIKYFGAYLTPILALITFNVSGIWAYTGIFILYLLIPILENIIPKDSYNFSKTEKQLAKHDFYYDLILYLLVPLHLYVIYVFFIIECFVSPLREKLNFSDQINFVIDFDYRDADSEFIRFLLYHLNAGCKTLHYFKTGSYGK